MTKKNLFLISGILTGIVFISSLFDSDPPSTFGSVWVFRIGMLLLSITSLTSYKKIKKSEK